MSKLLAFGGASLAVSSAVLASLAPGAALASSSCDAGATLITGDVCEITFTSGTHTFTPPAGITKLSALVVGAGGAGAASDYWWPNSYGGGGGDVKVVSLATSGAVSVAVGRPGVHGTDYSSENDSTVTQAATTVTSQGGRNADDTGPSGASGSGISGDLGQCIGLPACVAGGPGAGAGPISSPAEDHANGGAGLVVNAVAGASSTLFANDTTCLGGGGGTSTFGADNSTIGVVNGTASCGGGYGTLVRVADAYSSYTQVLPQANSGGGGGALRYRNLRDSSSDVAVKQSGAAGVVVLRYDSTLPNTGANSSAITTAAGLAGAGIIAGAIMIIAGLRRRKA